MREQQFADESLFHTDTENSVWDFGAIVNSMPSGGVMVIEAAHENEPRLS